MQMSNIKFIKVNSLLDSQISKLAEELSQSLTSRALYCQNLTFIIQDKQKRIHKHTLNLGKPINNFAPLDTLLVAVIQNYLKATSAICMCLQISKLSQTTDPNFLLTA